MAIRQVLGVKRSHRQSQDVDASGRDLAKMTKTPFLFVAGFVKGVGDLTKDFIFSPV